MPEPDPAPDDSTFSWEVEVTDSLLLLGVAYVFPSLLGGAVVLAGGLFVWLAVAAILRGRFERVVALVAVVVLGVLSRRYLPALFATDVGEPFRERYTRRRLVLSSVFGALVLLGSSQVHPMAPFAVFVAGWVPLVVTAAFPTSGHVDSKRETLVVDDTEIPVEAVRNVRTLHAGAFAVCWLSYARGVPSAPRVVVLPSERYEAVEQVIDTASDSSRRASSTIDWPERLVLSLFGLGMVSVGPLLWFVLPPGDGRAVALYAGAMFGFFGVLFLWYAYSA